MYKIVLIENNFTAEVKEEQITHKFIKLQIIKNIRKYSLINKENMFIYQFANKISFLVIEDKDTPSNKVNTPKINGITINTNNNIIYCCYQSQNLNKDITEIS